MKPDLTMPVRGRGRPNAVDEQKYDRKLKRWCEGIEEIDSTLDFKVSSRGWCYLLEEHGLKKGDFDTAQRLINNCRKEGFLPFDICCEDEGRAAEHVEDIDDETAEKFAKGWVEYLRHQVFLVEQAEAISAQPEWPKESFSELLKIGFEGCVVDNEDHPYLHILRGRDD